MFESLKPVAMDPMLGLMAAFRADTRTNKSDLGVGVYMNDLGLTPVMTSVKEAETQLMQLETTKSYQGIAGDPDYNQRILELPGDKRVSWATGREDVPDDVRSPLLDRLLSLAHM